jgi:hypothetical protein
MPLAPLVEDSGRGALKYDPALQSQRAATKYRVTNIRASQRAPTVGDHSTMQCWHVRMELWKYQVDSATIPLGK